MRTPRYDLEERLLEFASRTIQLTEELPGTRAASHVAGQLLRAATSPLANHGEAQAAESRADFIHKLRIGLKELREASRWLGLIRRVPLIDPPGKVDPLSAEVGELIRIFAKSIRTAQAGSDEPERRTSNFQRTSELKVES
jgi:four helix bundle protein